MKKGGGAMVLLQPTYRRGRGLRAERLVFPARVAVDPTVHVRQRPALEAGRGARLGARHHLGDVVVQVQQMAVTLLAPVLVGGLEALVETRVE